VVAHLAHLGILIAVAVTGDELTPTLLLSSVLVAIGIGIATRKWGRAALTASAGRGSLLPCRPGRRNNSRSLPNAHPDRDYEVDLEIPEFTCLCPVTGQPDLRDLPRSICSRTSTSSS
jgi:hypothetical protein